MKSLLATSCDQYRNARSLLAISINLESHLAIPFNQGWNMRSLPATFFDQYQNTKSLLAISKLGISFGDSTTKTKKMRVWSHYDGWPARVEKGKSGLILWVTYPDKKKDGEWSHSYGWPTQKKKYMVSLWWVTCPRKKEEWSHSLGDLPRGRNGLILMGDLPK